MRGGVVYRYDTGNKTGKKTPGGAGKHTGHTGDTRAHNRYSTDTGTVPTGTGTVLVRSVQYQVN